MTRDEMIKWLSENTTRDQWFKTDSFSFTDRPDGWKVVPNLNFDGLCVVKTKGKSKSNETIYFNDVFEQPTFIDGAKYRLNDMPFDFTYVKSTNQFVDISNPIGASYPAREFGKLFNAVLLSMGPTPPEQDSLFNRVKLALGERDVEITGEDHLIGQVKVDNDNSKLLGEIVDEFKIPAGDHVINWLRKHTKVEVKPTTHRSKYDREIVPGVFIDVYDVLSAFKTESPAVDHAVKKLLAPGKRGHKDRVTDLKEAIQSIEREIDRINQWSE